MQRGELILKDNAQLPIPNEYYFNLHKIYASQKLLRLNYFAHRKSCTNITKTNSWK